MRFHARDGVLTVGSGAGRGVYTCRSLACFERAATRRQFNRVLRTSVRIDPTMQALYTRPRSDGER